MPRQKLLLPFGGGLDRKTGSAVVDPDAHVDLRNVYLDYGRMEPRKGLAPAVALIGNLDAYILAVTPVRSKGLVALVVADGSASRRVDLYISNAAVSSFTKVGTLWTLNSALSGIVPQVHVADLYGYLIISHDEQRYQYRQTTKIYVVAANSFVDMEVDLDRDGFLEAVKFRGVARHLSYLLGWGYGTGADSDRGDTLRISKPGIPGSISSWFTPEHYFNVGAQFDPIVGGRPLGRRWMIAKSTESHVLNGSDARTFGVDVLDPHHGFIGPHAAINVDDRVYFWSLSGPRVTAGDESADLESPLDLDGPAPDAAWTNANLEYMWAQYDRRQEEVIFGKGTTGWAHVLHLKGNAPRWSYRSFGRNLRSAGVIYKGGVDSLGYVVPTPPPWGTRTGIAKGWQDIAYAPELDLFAAVNNDALSGDIMTSPDGHTWTGRSSPGARQWSSLAWGPGVGGGSGRFVAVARDGAGGATGQVITSENGTSWTARTASVANNWESVVWAAALSLYVAVASSGTADRVMTSPDGITWTTRTSANDYSWTGIAFGPGVGGGSGRLVAVAVSGTGNRVMTSDNGTAWTARTTPNDTNWRKVSWSPEKSLYAAVGIGAAKDKSIMTSPDGITWTLRAAPYGDTDDSTQWRDVTWGKDRQAFMAVGLRVTGAQDLEKLGMYSSDGLTWKSHAVTLDRNWEAIEYALELNRFVVVQVSATDAEVMVSPLTPV